MQNQSPRQEPEFSINDLVILNENFKVEEYSFVVQKNSICSVVNIFISNTGEGFKYPVAYELTNQDYQRYPNFDENFIMFIISQNYLD